MATLIAAALLTCHVHVSLDRAYAGVQEEGSSAAPFHSIGAAQIALRGASSPLRAPAGSPTRVCLDAGVYRETLIFNEHDGGAPNAPIIWHANSPGNVSLSGLVPLSFAALPANDPAAAFFPPDVVPGLFVADLSAAGIDTASVAPWPLARGFGQGCPTAQLELVADASDGGVQTAARWPNAVDASHGTTRGFALTSDDGSGAGSITSGSAWFDKADAVWLNWPTAGAPALQLHGLWHYEWADLWSTVGAVLQVGILRTQVARLFLLPTYSNCPCSP